MGQLPGDDQLLLGAKAGVWLRAAIDYPVAYCDVCAWRNLFAQCFFEYDHTLFVFVSIRFIGITRSDVLQSLDSFLSSILTKAPSTSQMRHAISWQSLMLL